MCVPLACISCMVSRAGLRVAGAGYLYGPSPHSRCSRKGPVHSPLSLILEIILARKEKGFPFLFGPTMKVNQVILKKNQHL